MSRPPRDRDALRKALRATAAALLVTALSAAAVSGCAERMFYHPDSELYSTPTDEGLAFERVDFRSDDGVRLTGWFIPAAGPARGTVVHCHGNAQNMTAHWQFAKFLPRHGYNLFVFDYRGYGRSEGRPSRRGTVEDAHAAVKYALGRADVDPHRLAIFGQSLGGAVAVVVAAREQRVKDLVIDSAFSSYREEAAYALRQNPVTWIFAWPLSRLFIRNGLDPAEHIAMVAPRPVLIIHGTADSIVPSSMSSALAERAGDPMDLWLIEGAGHTAAAYVRPAEYQARIVRLLEKAFGRASDEL